MTIEKKIGEYRIACYKYGFLTLLILMDEYESQQNFEECALIKAAIDRINSEFDNDIPTRMSLEACQYYYRSFMENSLLNKNNPAPIEHFIYYAECLKKDIENGK